MTTNGNNEFKLKSTWNLWVHATFKKDWSLQSYTHLIKISNFHDFYKFINNMQQFNYMQTHFFIMRNNIKPIWEDEPNRNGGTCKFKFTDNYLDAWEELSLYVLNEDIIEKCNTINGISFNPKNNIKNPHVIIKIWNSDNDDISTKINKDLLDKYKDVSIKYDKNAPEY